MLLGAAQGPAYWLGYVGVFVLFGALMWFVIRKWVKGYRAAIAYRASLEAQVASMAAAQSTSTATGGAVNVVLSGDAGSDGAGSDLSGVGRGVLGVDADRRALDALIESLPPELSEQVDPDELQAAMERFGLPVPGAAPGALPPPPAPVIEGEASEVAGRG